MQNQSHSKSAYSFGLHGPTIPLKEGIDINELLRPGGIGAEFDICNDDGLEEELKELNIERNKTYFEGIKNVSRLFDDDSDDDESSELSWFNRMKLKMQNLTDDGGIKKFVRKEGVGVIVPPNSKVRAHYDGYLEDLDEPFDSSRLRNKELQITLGKYEVIPGLEIAIGSMRVKEVARFMVAPSYAYGKMGCPPRIPGDSFILFEIELLGFTESSALDDYKELTDEEKRDLPFEKIVSVAKASTAVGNDFFARELFGKAIKKYMGAINVLETAPLQNGDEESQVIHMCIKAYLNMGLCHIKFGHYSKAHAAGKKVLGWKREHPKALYICGKSLRHIGNFTEARRFLMRAYTVAPRSKDVAVELKTLDNVEAKCHVVEKEMCKKMFS